MSNQTNKLSQAFQAFQRQDYTAARALLLGCEPGQAAHLRGLVERRLGQLDVALQQLRLASSIEPGNHEIYHNQGLVLLDLERGDDALAVFKEALRLKPDFVAAQKSYGRALRSSARWAEAREYYLELGQQRPADGAVAFGLATARLELGEVEQALDGFTRLLENGMDDGALHFMHGRAALQSGDHETGLASLLTAYALAPDALTLRELGRLYWMRDEREAFHELVSQPFDQPDMVTMALELLRLGGADLDQLNTVVRQSAGPELPVREAILAQAAVDASDPEQAVVHATRALKALPAHEGAAAALISACLMSGKPEQALQHARNMQEKQPDAQQWIAFEATALRLTDPEAYRKLVDVDRHVRVFTLPVPEGYATLADFNRDFFSALDRLHMFKAQPLDQSLRSGTQTARDLASVHDPVIEAYLAALDQPIRTYMSDMGASENHPLSRRNTGNYRLSGCWSVQLTGGGHHVNHMHPEGWISSAYYVAVPESDAVSRSGWIKFSEPPFETLPPLAPERWVQPEAGMLVLFPSYLWHGTAPIVDNAVRVTAPFDAVPV